jgi:RHS repeat-associated protein
MTTHAGLGGLVTMGVREYLPSLGRWLSADTIVPGLGNPQTLNRYSYVNNRPLNLVDPTGHCGTRADDPKCNDVADQVQKEFDKARATSDPKSSVSAESVRANWSIEQLRHLLSWLQRGVHFANSDGTWDAFGIASVIYALDMVQKAIGGIATTNAALNLKSGLWFVNKTNQEGPGSTIFSKVLADASRSSTTGESVINIYEGGLNLTAFVHEMGHVVDANAAGGGESAGLEQIQLYV